MGGFNLGESGGDVRRGNIPARAVGDASPYKVRIGVHADVCTPMGAHRWGHAIKIVGTGVPDGPQIVQKRPLCIAWAACVRDLRGHMECPPTEN